MPPPLRKVRADRPSGERDYFDPCPLLVEWLDDGDGRAAYFSKIDPLLTAPLISKIKTGRVPITFEYAIRMERAQKASLNPFRAIDIMTFPEDRDLYLYASGQVPAPGPVKIIRKPMGPRRKESVDGVGA